MEIRPRTAVAEREDRSEKVADEHKKQNWNEIGNCEEINCKQAPSEVSWMLQQILHQGRNREEGKKKGWGGHSSISPGAKDDDIRFQNSWQHRYR